jgi:hypothetical protein
MFKILHLSSARSISLFSAYLRYMPKIQDLLLDFTGGEATTDQSYALRKVSELLD